jgi:hypothetical protein
MNDRRWSRPNSTAVPIIRLVSLVVMLMIIGLTIYNLHQRAQDAVAPPAGQQNAPPVEAEKAAAARAKDRKPIADEDPEEWKRFLRNCDAVRDKSTLIDRYELPAYWRVMSWVQSQSLADLKERSFPSVPFQNFIHYPSKYRGKPVRVELSIRSVTSYAPENAGKGSIPKKVYQLNGMPTELDGWWYYVVTPELPAGFPEGRDIDVTATVYGYFFKLQGYQPFDAKPDARPLLAPLIVGRVERAAVMGDTTPPGAGFGGVVLLVGGIILIVVVVGWIVAARRKPFSRVQASMGLPESVDPDLLEADAADFDTTDEVERD